MKLLWAAITIQMALWAAPATACAIRPEDIQPDRRPLSVLFEQADAVVLARLKRRSVMGESSVVERYAVVERFKGSTPEDIETTFTVLTGCGFVMHSAPEGGQYNLFLEPAAEGAMPRASKIEGPFELGSDRSMHFMAEIAALAAKEHKMRIINK